MDFFQELMLRLRKSSLASNIAALYSIQIVNYVLPLVTIPYLARVLGASSWGLVAFSQAFGTYFLLLIHFGFALSATRAVAQHRGDKDALARLLAGVMSAKAVLSVVSVILALTIGRWIPVFRDHPMLLWSCVLWFLAQGFDTSWFFQGLERMKLIAQLNALSKLLGLAALFVFVRQPSDNWKVLVVNASGSLIATGLVLFLAYRVVPWRSPSIRATAEAFKLGWPMFIFKGSAGIYTFSNTMILGLLTTPELVGYYSGAERIAKGAQGLLGPVSQALFPRMTHLVKTSQLQASQLIRTSLKLMLSLGLGLGLLLFIFAPVIVRFLLGAGFEPAILPLRILALLSPLLATSNVLGIQWMLPLGLDRAFNTVIISSGIISILLSLLLTHLYDQVGTAIAMTSAEALVVIGILGILATSGPNPFSTPANQ